MQAQEKVYLDHSKDEVDIKTQNQMGGAHNTLSKQQLKEMQETVIKLRQENNELRSEWDTKEAALKALTNKVRDEKTQVEKKLYN